jgi:hypothetical protein
MILRLFWWGWSTSIFGVCKRSELPDGYFHTERQVQGGYELINCLDTAGASFLA